MPHARCTVCRDGFEFRRKTQDEHEPEHKHCGRLACRIRHDYTPENWAGRARMARAKLAAGTMLVHDGYEDDYSSAGRPFASRHFVAVPVVLDAIARRRCAVTTEHHLFPLPPLTPGYLSTDPPESAGRRRTRRQRETLAHGYHPATGERLLDADWGYHCRDCAHAVPMSAGQQELLETASATGSACPPPKPATSGSHGPPVPGSGSTDGLG